MFAEQASRYRDAFRANLAIDRLNPDGPVRARNMFFEATLIDFITTSVEIIPPQVVAEYRAQWIESDPFGGRALEKLPIQVQENLMLLELICDEAKRSAGDNPEARGDAFGDTTGETYVDSFRLKASALLRDHKNWTLTDACEWMKDNQDWYAASKSDEGGVGRKQ